MRFTSHALTSRYATGHHLSWQPRFTRSSRLGFVYILLYFINFNIIKILVLFSINKYSKQQKLFKMDSFFFHLIWIEKMYFNLISEKSGC